LIIKNDDLVVATHGRGFWILDNITPLRQFDRPEGGPAPMSSRGNGAGAPPRRSDVTLFKPQKALRVRANLNTDTPLPPDEPAGENPPDGAMIDYFLSKDASGPVTIEIKNGKGQLIRKYSSADKPVAPNPKRLRIPSYWIRPPQLISTKAGMAPVSVGYALHTDRGCGTGVPDFRDVSQHGAASNISLDRAG